MNFTLGTTDDRTALLELSQVFRNAREMEDCSIVEIQHDHEIAIADRLSQIADRIPIPPYVTNGLVHMLNHSDGRLVAFMGRGVAFKFPRRFSCKNLEAIDFYEIEVARFSDCASATIRLLGGDTELRVMRAVQWIGDGFMGMFSQLPGAGSIWDHVAGRDVPLYEWHFKRK